MFKKVLDIKIDFPEFNNLDLYNCALRLFSSLNYPITPLKNTINQNVNEYIHQSLDKKVLFGKDEQFYLDEISSISTLFVINEEILFEQEISSQKNNEIIFIAIEIVSSKRDRSHIAYGITKIINKIYTQHVFILFYHEEHILFSSLVYEIKNEELSGEVFLSDWFSSVGTNQEEINTISCLSFGNHCCYSVDYLYHDLIYSISREYYIYPESNEFITYGSVTTEMNDIFKFGMSFRERLEEWAKMNKEYYINLYGDDFVCKGEVIDLLLEEEEMLLLDLDHHVHEILENELKDKDLSEEEDKENSGESNDDLEELDRKLFEDPIQMLKWLEKN